MLRRPAPWRSWPLASQLLAWVLCIVVVTVALGGVLSVVQSRSSLDDQYQLRALGIASSVAQRPDVVALLESGDPAHGMESIAASTAQATGASYVVVSDARGIRYSHPDPLLIGRKLEEPVAVLDGRTHRGIDVGSLGRSANGKAPIFSADHRVIGQVSVGILEARELDQLTHDAGLIALYSILVLGLGALGSWILARRIKRVTFGLEPASIAALLQEREALLHGIREGVIGFDTRGDVTLINAEARRLLGLHGTIVGGSLEGILPPGRLLDILTGRVEAPDGTIVTDDALLVANRMPVTLGGRDIGSVVTLRDRTELEGLIREIGAAEGLTDALRAQEHEYSNRLHVLAGLLEIGDVGEATDYLSQVVHTPSLDAADLRSRIAPVELAALLTAKITVAAEQGIRLVVTDESRLVEPRVAAPVLPTVVGNLVDNAIDALATWEGEREIRVGLSDEGDIRIRVDDTGPGVPPELVDSVLTDGFTTKERRSAARRGLGLALVHRIVRRHGGRIEVTPGPGGHFEVVLPPDPTLARPDHQDARTTKR